MNLIDELSITLESLLIANKETGHVNYPIVILAFGAPFSLFMFILYRSMYGTSSIDKSSSSAQDVKPHYSKKN